MDLRQAYERLGVEPGTEPKKARRAYLKLLKVHKPETDPAGFQSIREAWETIQGAKDWEIEALDRAPEPANAAPPDPFRMDGAHPTLCGRSAEDRGLVPRQVANAKVGAVASIHTHPRAQDQGLLVDTRGDMDLVACPGNGPLDGRMRHSARSR